MNNKILIPVRSLFANNDGGWELFDIELVIFVVTDDIGCVEFVIAIESLLLIDVCLDICFVEGEWIFCCLDVELLLDVVVVDVDGRVFCETIVEYCRIGWIDVVVDDVG
jgi:hypothetical protein